MADKTKSPRRKIPQLSIRSEYARTRTRDLSKRTGKTATQIIEDALRAYDVAKSDGQEARDRLSRDLADIRARVRAYGPFPISADTDAEMYDEWGLPR